MKEFKISLINVTKPTDNYDVHCELFHTFCELAVHGKSFVNQVTIELRAARHALNRHSLI